MRKVTILVILLSILSGCGSMSTREKAWHVLHAVDVAQTMQIADSECHEEGLPGTYALIGKKPSKEKVLAWGVATALLQHYASDVLPKTVMNMEFALKIGIVANNENIGMHVDSWECID